jgi:hypothetical protein
MIAMEYGKAFAFMTDDQDWIKKFLLAAVMVFIPVLGGFLLLGYSLEITRRVIKSESPVLPEWSDFGDFLKKGFVSFIVVFVYTLPTLLLSACAQAPQVALLVSDSRDNSIQMMAAGIALCFACLTLLVGLVTGLLAPIALGRVADTGQIGSAFRFDEMFKLLRTKPGIYLITVMIISLTALILVPIGTLACFVGLFPVVAYINLVAAHLYGQAYKVTKAESGLA